ncbi:MAG: ATP-binding protein [Pseudolysinimonas sp.]|uniref:AAA family ATPase n=1 Tax=Pseudolysinimonas sp. TaxID=2680009 RepID=UPI003C793B4A
MGGGASSRASDNLAERVRASAAAQGATRLVVLIDGHSGSGKTTLATQLAERLEALQISLDDMYPGWGGLEVGSAMVRGVLDPTEPGYRRWDWNTNQPAGWRTISTDRDLVIEGSGAMSRANRALATFGIWVRLDQQERKRRALARDGPTIHQNWDRWTAQEQAFFARERPDTLADAIMDGRTGEFVFRADLGAPEK